VRLPRTKISGSPWKLSRETTAASIRTAATPEALVSSVFSTISGAFRPVDREVVVVRFDSRATSLAAHVRRCLAGVR
jgi:hypothetical protein